MSLIKFTPDTSGTIGDSLVAYWKLEESSGNRSDFVSAMALTDTNTVTSTAGKVGTSAFFTSANSEMLTVTDNATLSMGDIDFTIACWVNLTSTVGNYTVFGKWNSAGNSREYGLRLTTTTWQFLVSGTGLGAGDLKTVSLGTPSTSTWYFLVVYHDATANEIGISINGGAFTTTATSAGVFDGTANFQMGALESSDYFGGAVDELGIWKKKLSSTEISDLYNSGSGNTPFRTVSGGMRII
jgi:hypothetical protein